MELSAGHVHGWAEGVRHVTREAAGRVSLHHGAPALLHVLGAHPGHRGHRVSAAACCHHVPGQSSRIALSPLMNLTVL